MALSKRLALLGALSVTKPRGLGSSWGFFKRHQSSNLTKDAKLGSGSSKPKVSPERAFAEPRNEAEKLQAGFESNDKRTPDQVWADFEITSAKFNETIRQSGVEIGEAFEKLAEERSKNFKEVAAEIEIARKQMNMFCAGVIVFVAASVGVGTVLVSQHFGAKESNTRDN